MLAAAEPLARSDPEALEYIGQRLHLLAWVLRRTDERRTLLQRVDGWSSDPQWAQQVQTWRAGLDGLTGGFIDRLQSAREALRQADLDPTARRLQELILGVSLLSAGQAREAGALARRLRPRLPFTHNFDLYALGLSSLAAEARTTRRTEPRRARWARSTCRVVATVTPNAGLPRPSSSSRTTTRWAASSVFTPCRSESPAVRGAPCWGTTRPDRQSADGAGDRRGLRANRSTRRARQRTRRA